jgi:hypothetical protein
VKELDTNGNGNGGNNGNGNGNGNGDANGADENVDGSDQLTLTHRRFVRDVLAACVRLSYYERVQATVPREFACLMPPHETIVVPSFGGATDDSNTIDGVGIGAAVADALPFTAADEALCVELRRLLVAKTDADVVVTWLRANVTVSGGVTSGGGGGDGGDADMVRARLLLVCLLQHAQRTYHHARILTARYATTLRTLVTAGDGDGKGDGGAAGDAGDIERREDGLVNVVVSLWRRCRQHRRLLLTMLWHNGVIGVLALVRWSFNAAQFGDAATHNNGSDDGSNGGGGGGGVGGGGGGGGGGRAHPHAWTLLFDTLRAHGHRCTSDGDVDVDVGGGDATSRVALFAAVTSRFASSLTSSSSTAGVLGGYRARLQQLLLEWPVETVHALPTAVELATQI